MSDFVKCDYCGRTIQENHLDVTVKVSGIDIGAGYQEDLEFDLHRQCWLKWRRFLRG